MENREQALEELLVCALAALRDLDAGYPWRELLVDLDTMLEWAAEFDVYLEED